jgi:hypothetical protein
MFVIDENNKVMSIRKKTFTELGFSERKDLQEWIADNPDILGEPLLIIQKEFDGFFDTNERLDLLALDATGNLVVIENKLDDSGRDVVWQALKYVSYCALLKLSEIRDIYQKYLGSTVVAEDKLSEFFNGDDFENIRLNPQDGDQRLILVAANFRKEVTTAVLWLRDHGVDVKCIRVTPYEDNDRIYLDAEQILPVQDVGDYQVRLSAKKQEDVAGSKGESARKKLVKSFWERALPTISDTISVYKGHSPSPDHWVNGSSGHSGIYFTLIRLTDRVRVEINIDTGDKDTNKKIFGTLFAKKDEYESALGYELEWLELPEKRTSRIVGASYSSALTDTEVWQEAVNWLSENMKKLYDVLKKPIDSAAKGV